MSPRQAHFSPKQIAEALGASESSVKRWCDQGSIPTVRTVGGHRRITLDGLASFLQETGRSLLAPSLLGIPPTQSSREVVVPKAALDVQNLFRKALASGDEVECRKMLRGLIDQGSPRSEAACLLITDAMQGIGYGWVQKTVETYEERRAVNVAMRLIDELRAEVSDRVKGAPIAIGGTPPGDHYQLPTALVELTLRESGWQATNLGANLPWETLRQAAIDYRPRMLWLSISEIVDADAFVLEHNRFFDEISSDVAVFLGGRALTDEIRPKLSFTAHCDSLRHLVELSNLFLLR